MDGEHIILNIRKAKYYTNDLFEPNKFYPCSEKFFNETVVKYRNCFIKKYLRKNVQLFEDKNSDIKFIRRWYS